MLAMLESSAKILSRRNGALIVKALSISRWANAPWVSWGGSQVISSMSSGAMCAIRCDTNDLIFLRALPNADRGTNTVPYKDWISKEDAKSCLSFAKTDGRANG